MEVFRRLPPPSRRAPCALTIGNFDGVHLGHQAMLAELRSIARPQRLPVCVLTFDPHPREWFAAHPRPGAPAMEAPARISTTRDKLEALAGHGVDRVCIARFNAALASLPAEAFVEEILMQGLMARSLLVGDDFRFGARRTGDFALLQRYANEGAFQLHRMDTIEREGVRVSSSEVRATLASGNLARAAQLLGRPYTISGHVVHGRKLGRNLGFPTLNVPLGFDKPALAGIFVVQVHGLAPDPMRGVASLGTRPAVERNGKPLLEVHLFDFSSDVYGALVRVEFLQKLRDEAHFESLDALRRQIDLDAAQARAWFQRPSP